MRPELNGADVSRLLAALTCVALGAALTALGPVALKLLVDALSGEGASLAWLTLAPLALLAAYVGAQWAGRMASELRMLLFGGAEQSISRKLSRKLFSHVMALPLRFHLGRATGAVAQTLENGLQGYRLIMQHALFTLLPGILEIVIMAAIIAIALDPVFLAIFGACALLYVLAFADGARKVLRASRAVSSARIDANAQLADGLLNFETVKSFTGEAAVSRRYDETLAEAQTRWGAFYRARFVNGVRVALIFATGLAATLWFAVARVQSGAMTIGDFILVNAYMLQIVRPLELLGYGVRDIGQGAAFIERMLDLLDEEPEPSVSSGGEHSAADLARAQGAARVAFENVTFSYVEGQPVLRDLSFEIEPGAMTALVGASGGGKSSIVRLILRFYEPDAGRILFDGVPLTDYPPAELRRLIALVPQDTSLFNASLAFNIGFPEYDNAREDIERAASLANLDTLIAKLPDGFDTIVGERGLKLSGGEKQRVAIARASLKQPRLFIADEATSSLDSRTEAEIVENLAIAARGVTTLVIAHRLSTVVKADEIIVLDRGKIVERGTHAELLARNGLYADLWRAQTENES
ncbi:ATP-binding cassette domain-containing protein [Hyphomonas adhaerens]|uniref:ATP-binding cassette domain-containing protein n=1 Tax=Hyphomonas adhaerens TaxID=81029 RepID=UPI002356C530|nr:ABC transporter transmembrane domain-containing protein [Hyphomonas adhaerens]